jgi:Fe-Mn family superoxide dismutase
MDFVVEPLPYAHDALEPHISQETVNFHYEKHHKGYMTKLAAALEGTPEAAKSLEELIVKHADAGFYNLAAQVWNHTFYWKCMSRGGGGEPSQPLKDLLTAQFGSFEAFKSEFIKVSEGLFGSGWAWLVQDKDKKLSIIGTGNAVNPMSDGLRPLLTLDVWEHAYYLDYQNKRPEYIQVFFEHLVNWDFVAEQLQ